VLRAMAVKQTTCRRSKFGELMKGQSGTLKEVTLPGQCVSVDQVESPVAGFIGQNEGFFFRKRYKVARICSCSLVGALQVLRSTVVLNLFSAASMREVTVMSPPSS
jgi:hypothetical protein